jgi:hypothetical protein
MQNFVGASKLVGNTQNRPTIPKNRIKTLKTEHKESLEARRTFVGVSPELIGEDRTGRPLKKQQQQTQTMTTDQRFNNKKSNRRNFFFPMAAATSPEFFFSHGRCNFSGHHRALRPQPQNREIDTKLRDYKENYKTQPPT